MNSITVVVVDNNIIDNLLLLDNKTIGKLNDKVIFETHHDIFEETRACKNTIRKKQLIDMYPKFRIKTIDDNSFPMSFEANFFSKESRDMQILFLNKKQQTTNNLNDSQLILMQYENQSSNPNSILVSNNKKDFQNFCIRNYINWCDWNSFIKRINT